MSISHMKFHKMKVAQIFSFIFVSNHKFICSVVINIDIF